MKIPLLLVWLMSVGTNSFAMERLPSHSKGLRSRRCNGHARRESEPEHFSMRSFRPFHVGANFDGTGILRQKKRTPSTMLSVYRGGFIDIPSLAIGTEGATMLVTMASAFFLANGLLFGLAPNLGASLFGIDLEGDVFSRYLLEAIGAVAFGHGINVLLSTVVSGVSPQRAIGFGMLIRLAFLAKSFALNTYEKMDAETRFLSVNSVIMSWTTFSLLTGAGNPFLAAKVFSTMALAKACLLLMRPTKAATKIFGLDASAEGMLKPRTLCQILGEHLAVSGVFMEALAFGVEPVRAVGLSSATWAAVRSFFLFVSKPYRDLGTGPLLGMIHLIFALVLSVGLLPVA